MSIKLINGEIIKIGNSDVEISSSGISMGAGKQINFGDGTSLSSYASSSYSPSVYEFTTSSAPVSATGENGPWVWTPPSCSIVEFLLIGGGGGGGSGARQPTNTHRYGGGGGGGGGFVSFTVLRNLITNPISIKVGSGGGGGASRTSDSSNGLAGSQGESTFLGWTGLTSLNGGYASGAPYIFRIEGGFGGGGGTTSSATSGSGGRVTLPGSASYAIFQGGPGGTPTTGAVVTPGRIGYATVGGGGGGTASSGGQYGVGGNIDLAGYSTAGNLFYAFTDSNLIGTITKHGGDSKNNENSDNGSTGVGYGGGGGGGGASNNGYNSGAGGNGSGGYVRVICW